MATHTSSFEQDYRPKPRIPLGEMLKSVPEIFGIRLNEEPSYDVLLRDGPFTVRHYASQLVAEVTIPGASLEDFRDRAFNRLAAYIFGDNLRHQRMDMTAPVLQQKSSEQMAMTAPVLQQRDERGAWTMTFILPSKYGASTVPRPLDNGITLREISAYDAAAVRYSGNNALKRIQENEAKLDRWLASQPRWRRQGGFFTAQYDAPFVIPFFKRNEILCKVERA